MPVILRPMPPRYLALPRRQIWLPLAGFLPHTAHCVPMTRSPRKGTHTISEFAPLTSRTGDCPRKAARHRVLNGNGRRYEPRLRLSMPAHWQSPSPALDILVTWVIPAFHFILT